MPLHVLISTVAQCESLQDICGRTSATCGSQGPTRSAMERGPVQQMKAPHEIYLADMEAVKRAVDDVISRSQL